MDQLINIAVDQRFAWSLEGILERIIWARGKYDVMENKQSSSKKKLIPTQREKVIREINYDSLTRGSSRQPKKELHLDLEILQKHNSQCRDSQRVLVSIKPRANPIKTLYIAEKKRLHNKKTSEKSRSRLAIGDHSSFATHFSEDDTTFTTVNSNLTKKEQNQKSGIEILSSVVSAQVESSTTLSKCSQSEVILVSQEKNVYNEKLRSAEKCYIYTQPQITMNIPKVVSKVERSKVNTQKVDIATLIITNTSSEDSLKPSTDILYKLQTRIDNLERKVLRQEMVFRTIDPTVQLSSSDEEAKENAMKESVGVTRPGCSYIEQYSHIPETSAFQRYAQQTAPLSPSKATTIDKEHNSEQYGRNFTTYDGITARGRRQCASVPCKRDDVPKLAAERVHKIRHKLNPVRDYRLMDTVHYLAQGEFAPRDDGIKLTPSREAVLSDIIYEDVCRTHWPNTRLGRRGHTERCSTRSELQRLIDSLLRERVAHVERRRRRHYRIVKLNHRHENCRPLGKTGDIIVASHKNKHVNEEKDATNSDHNASIVMSHRRCDGQNSRRGPRSHDRMMLPEVRPRRRYKEDDCTPGPSYALPRSTTNREPTCCYQTSSIHKIEPIPIKNAQEKAETSKKSRGDKAIELTSGSSVSACRGSPKNPRLVVKKDTSRRRYHARDESNLEHYILLPTLVVRTPSNMKRQKKFNELYHRILNAKIEDVNPCAVGSESTERRLQHNPDMKDIGFNINITPSNSEEKNINH